MGGVRGGFFFFRYVSCVCISGSEGFVTVRAVPFSIAITLSAFLMVESLCAMIMVVLSFMRPSRAFCTSASEVLSREEVASSSTRIGEFLSSALAMELFLNSAW
ncbi:membrane protein [Candidatus Magnetobacterium bavaricum]|uniref:Membrane protein n=1 Tax=Candidatus Magnetobacterium bavaricum TaxID=29290 RepID=A0A0F3GTT6_9BACT|nr:membrane protein [Candidatus Magnetobacterium bavaricum]